MEFFYKVYLIELSKNMKHLDEDNLQNERFQAILILYNTILGYLHLLKTHLIIFQVLYFNNLKEKLLHLLTEYNEVFFLINNFLIIEKDNSVNQL